MGLKNLIKGQLLSSISYRSSDPQELAAVYDRDGRRIMYESVLTVMPGQAAILVNEGQMTDIFMSGRYELTTNNMPVTTTLNQWKYGFHDTFIVDIIFVNTNEIIDIPWGTSEQVTVKDEVFGLVNVGANGKYSLSITDPKLFAENLMGVKNRYTVADLKSFVTPQIAMYFKEIVTEKQMDFFDMQGYCYEAAQILKAKSDDFFGRYGIQMQKMAVQVALPETVKKSIDERASLGAFGGMDAYAYKRQVDAQPHLHELLELFFVKNTAFIKSFKAHSAAKSIHHGFVGGLLEHTLSVTKLCDFYTTRYPHLNHDLLITAAICHDIGKTKELSLFPSNDYTDEGQLIGHIVTGVEMIHDAIREIPGFPVVLANELKHCIVAHHGELEYGSPKKPALMEAMALNLADNTDARMETMTEIFDRSEDNLEWLGFNRIFESNIRRTSK